MQCQFSSSPGYAQISSAIGDQKGRLRNRAAMGTSCRRSDAILLPFESMGILAFFSPKRINCWFYAEMKLFHYLFIFFKIKYLLSQLTELHASSKMRREKKKVSFVSLFILIKIFVRGIYCLFFCFPLRCCSPWHYAVVYEDTEY